ncbi:MAG: single-stranded-DNA-specific exonuclease RecJ [Gammaproteobacteria bacterium]|nr:single-stranded-DNA-specific exonuclease RecJ [Gammaproteobacteria bacterium]
MRSQQIQTLTRQLRLRGPSRGAALSVATLDPVLARLYAARGVTNERELDYSLARLAPVGALGGIEQSVAVLQRHRRSRIIVVGDFDADGATSTALVLRCLRRFGFDDCGYLVPNRFEFGYGLTPEIVDEAAKRRPQLLVTVDNGVSSCAGVNRARDLGIEVLITDHHLPGKDMPATTILNPNLPDNGFPSPHLAGVGVAFYLMAALGRALEQEGLTGAARIPADYLDLVALGTIADVVRLDHNNRILVTQGLQRIRAGRCVPGIHALLEQSGRATARVCSSDLGFAAGPRLNAAGRLDDMSIGIECLLTDDASVAADLARQLDAINRERRNIEAGMREQAYAFVDTMQKTAMPACVCLFNGGWHQGIVGLIAARVRERCHRPVIAFARDKDDMLKGSGRSVPGVHIRDLLEAVATSCPQLIERFGGHAMAAGLSLAEANLSAFSIEVAAQLERLYPDADFSGAIVTDGALSANALNLSFARQLRDAGPWGAGFPEPVFSGTFDIVEQRTVGESHLKMRVSPRDHHAVLDAIAFNQAGPAYRGSVELVYRLDVNEFRGIESPQLVVEQIVSPHYVA